MSTSSDVSLLLTPERSNSIAYILITNKYCTLKELKEYYDIYDVLDMYEMCIVNLQNKSTIMKGGNL